MIVILFGPPGCGKGTQSLLIAEKYQLKHISTGDLLRKEIEEQSAIGKQVKSFIDSGTLVPDSLIVEMLMLAMNDQHEHSNGIILDGFPRTIAQAEILQEKLNGKGKSVSVMIDLQVEKDELIRRMIHRGQLTGRTDDTPETIEKRLEVYDQMTAPVISFYKNSGKYQAVHGMHEVETVFNGICEIIEKKVV